MTSVDLTADNKTDLKNVLSPHIAIESDIYGASDIATLLRAFPEVERTHYKLWLTSTAVLDRVINSDIYQQTEHVLKNLAVNAIRYVQNKSYPDAREILANSNVCVIAGRAGIGKTTLAEMLLLQHIADGFQPVVVSQDASEANKLWSPDPTVPQIFYYDDFLGQAATAEKLNKNEDDRLALLLSRVSATKNKRLILTTREYILEQAKQDYERLQRMNIDAHKHVIRLEDYTRLHKAQILYNHLYFSDLDPEVRSSIVDNKAYLSIIDHTNYTPRLIDDIVRRARLDGVTADNFPKYFLGVLDDPKTLWQQTFDRSISPEARLVLLSLASLPTTTTLSALRATYESLQTDALSKPFLYAVKEVDGDFLRTAQSGALTIVSFFNPSVRDFVVARLFENVPLRTTLLERVPFFDQILSLVGIEAKAFSSPEVTRNLIRTFESGYCLINSYGDGTNKGYALSGRSKIDRLQVVLAREWIDVPSPWLTSICRPLSEDWAGGAFGNQSAVLPLIETVRLKDPALGDEMFEAARKGLCEGEMEDLDDVQFARAFMMKYGDRMSDDERAAVADQAEPVLDYEIEHLLDLKDPSDVREGLEQLQETAETFGHTISYGDARRVEDHASQLENDYDEAPDWDSDRSGDYYVASVSNDVRDIDNLFDSLERD